MAVKIRLKRMGAKKNPYYRVVVADSRFPRNGRFIAEIGTYNPQTDPSTVNIDLEIVREWISKGAQPTETVRKLIKIAESAPAEVAAESIVESKTETAEEAVTEEAAAEATVTVEAVTEETGAAETVEETAAEETAVETEEDTAE